MFSYIRKAQYHETDQMGFIHHSNYIKWMEEARIAFMDAIGAGYAAMEKTGIASPVVSLSVEYKQPVYFDDEVEIQVNVSQNTGAKIELSYAIYNRTRGELSTKALSKHCFIKAGRLLSVKRELPDLYEKLAVQESAT